VIIKEVGIGLAIAVAVDASVVRILLVPAIMRLLGRVAWWAPRPVARLHQRLALGEAA
jgi:RND superfamily putative drug exporter